MLWLCRIFSLSHPFQTSEIVSTVRVFESIGFFYHRSLLLFRPRRVIFHGFGVRTVQQEFNVRVAFWTLYWKPVSGDLSAVSIGGQVGREGINAPTPTPPTPTYKKLNPPPLQTHSFFTTVPLPPTGSGLNIGYCIVQNSKFSVTFEKNYCFFLFRPSSTSGAGIQTAGAPTWDYYCCCCLHFFVHGALLDLRIRVTQVKNKLDRHFLFPPLKKFELHGENWSGRALYFNLSRCCSWRTAKVNVGAQGHFNLFWPRTVINSNSKSN